MLKLSLLYGAAFISILNAPSANNRAHSVHAPRLGIVSTPASESLLVDAPIWGEDDGAQGYAFLPVTIHGTEATVVINLNCTECDLTLSTAALAGLGIAATATAPTIGLTVGSLAIRNVPVQYDSTPDWLVFGPSSLPPVVGIVGVHFMITHFDILYDFPHRRVRLYAFALKSVQHEHPSAAWLPPEIKTTDCGRRIPTPPGAATFTGMEMKVDGHPVTGVIEMRPYGSEFIHDEKMSQEVFNALQLPANSPRIEPMRYPPGATWRGRPLKDQVTGVTLTIGSHAFWTGPVKVFPILDVQEVLHPNTPVMLINLTTIKPFVMYVSSGTNRVCISKP